MKISLTAAITFLSFGNALGFRQLHSQVLSSNYKTIPKAFQYNNRLFNTRTVRKMSTTSSAQLAMDAFVMRQFNDPSYKGTKINYDSQEFGAKVNEFYDSKKATLQEGYAPFCKHLFIPNFAGVESGTVAITPENEHLLRSSYDARSEKELPVLVRYFPEGSVARPTAKFLDIILYSREQIIKENEAMGNENKPEDQSAPWGIISVKAQDVDFELPMAPITMMRNALGKDQGGSGVDLEIEKYKQSVEFWRKNATLK